MGYFKPVEALLVATEFTSGDSSGPKVRRHKGTCKIPPDHAGSGSFATREKAPWRGPLSFVSIIEFKNQKKDTI